MNKRRLLYFLLVVVFIIGAALLIVGGVLYLHYSTQKSHSAGTVNDQVAYRVTSRMRPHLAKQILVHCLIQDS